MDSAADQKNSENALLIINGIIKTCVDRSKSAPLHRSDARYIFDAPVVLGAKASKEFEPVHEAWCINISNKGIGLIIDKKLANGDSYLLRLPLGGEGKYLFILIRIKRISRLFGGVYKAGGTFIYDEDQVESDFAEAMRKNREFVPEESK